jgi:TRAP-type C4-dicarboxylate transport system permease small subunit
VKFFKVIEDLLAGVVNIVLVVLFFTMLGFAVLQICLRYFFGGGILWGDILARNLVMWVGFLGAVLATREDKHFHIDVLTRFLTFRWQLYLRSITNLFSAIVCYFLGQAATTFLQLDPDGKAFLNVPTVVAGSILPVGFYLMMILFVIQSIVGLTEGIRYHPATDKSGS